MDKGFTLVELIVVMTIIGVLSIVAYPYFAGWVVEAEYRKAARDIASALRFARTKAVSCNREFDVVFDLVENTYMIREGSRATDTPTDGWKVVFSGSSMPKSINLKGYLGCTNDTDETFGFHFNPNGSSSNRYICVVDNLANKKFRIGIPKPTTGRIYIRRWNGAQWE